MSDTPENKQRLLIVDDSKVIRVTARKILQDHFSTVEAVDGNNAWDVLNSEEPFSLIVSDLTMPNLDGFGLLEKIRNSNLPHISNVPVIIITGANDSEPTKQRATDAGATDFIGKPFDAVHLLERAHEHIDTYTTESLPTEATITLEDHATVIQPPDRIDEDSMDEATAVDNGNIIEFSTAQAPDTAIHTPTQTESENFVAASAIAATDLPTEQVTEADETQEKVTIDSMPDLETMVLTDEHAATEEPIPTSPPFSLEDFDQEETIVITAPGDYYVAEEKPETSASDTTSETIASTNDLGTTASTAEEYEVEPDKSRTGFFARLWSLLSRKI